MITIGTGSSRPASSIPIPGTSHATASNAGATVTAAKTHPGSPLPGVRAPLKGRRRLPPRSLRTDAWFSPAPSASPLSPRSPSADAS